jgi:hypothetical protein
MRPTSPLLLLSVLGSLALLACGGETPPPEAPKPATPAPIATAAPTAAPEAPPAPEASAAPAAQPEAPADNSRPPSGRPPILMSSAEEITNTFGMTPAAKLEIGDDSGRAVLRIPEYAFDRGVNVTFKLDKKGKSGGPVIGKIYRTQMQYAGQPNFITVTSSGPPFVLEMPAGSKKDANLAVGDIVQDEKTGRDKVTWTIQAPKRIDDVTNVAVFELTALGDFYLHVTTKKPTEPAPAPAK